MNLFNKTEETADMFSKYRSFSSDNSEYTSTDTNNTSETVTYNISSDNYTYENYDCDYDKSGSQYNKYYSKINRKDAKIIHQTWKSKDIPYHLRKYVSSWIDKNPDYDYILWDDNDCYNFIKKEYPDFLNTYVKLTRPVEKADFFRYLVVYHYGGIYTDLDCECIKPINQWKLDKYKLNISKEVSLKKGSKTVDHYCQWVFYSPRKNKILLKVLNAIVNKVDGGYVSKCDEDVLDLTGPGMWSKIINNNINDKIKIHPQERFAWVDWLGPYGNYENKIWCLHHFEGSWRNNGISPKILHQTWKTKEFPAPFDEWRDMWLNMCPDYEYKFYDDDDLEDIIKTHFPQYLSFYNSMSKNIERIDFCRYAILYIFGGVYIDCDTIPLKSLDFWLEKKKIIIGKEPVEHARHHWHNDNLLCNAIMISPKNDTFWLDLMEFIKKNYKYNFNPVNNTGPIAMSKMYEKYPEKYQNIIITEPNCFYPITNGYNFKTQTINGKLFKSVSANCDVREAFVVHMWANTWCKDMNGNESTVSAIISAGIALLLVIFLISFSYFHGRKIC